MKSAKQVNSCKPQAPGEVVEDHPNLFDAVDDWRSEWVGMPEFVQERQREYAKLTVRFRCQEDLDDFARLIGQRLNVNSQCTWHPELKPNRSVVKKYVSDDA